MTKYSGKMLVKLRSKAGYETRDNFYHSLGVELKKQGKSVPSYKTIQRMETKNKFSKKTLKLVCDFLTISPDDLVEKEIDKKSDEDFERGDPKYSLHMTTPNIAEAASQIKKAIANSKKRIFIFDYEEKNLSIYQDKAIQQLLIAIDNYANTKKNPYDVINDQDFSPSNAFNLGKNINTISQIEYCLNGLRSGSDWMDIGGENTDVHGLEFAYNGNLADGEGKHPLYFYCLNYNYITYWPFPEHLYNNYMSNSEEETFMLDIYHPKKERIMINNDIDQILDFDPENDNNLFRLTPTLLKYSIFILSSSRDIDLLYIPSQFPQLINKEIADVIFGVPDETKSYLFGKEFKGGYKKILNDIENNESIPKIYLDSDDFKIIYGKSNDITEQVKKVIEKQTGKKYTVDKASVKKFD